jgi:hypothetical protein
MRELFNPQLQLGQVDIGCIEFDLQSRDDIPQLLRGVGARFISPLSIHGRVRSASQLATPGKTLCDTVAPPS